MESYLLIGPGIEEDVQQLSREFAENNHVLKIHGDKKNLIDCKNLNFPEYSQVLIDAHGNEEKSNHVFNLCKNQKGSEQSLKAIAKNKALNFELYSCHSGAAINLKTSLSKWSTLITSVESEKSEVGAIVEESIIRLMHIEHNPFIRFAAYIFAKPNSVKFAVQSEQNYAHIYSTDNSFKRSLIFLMHPCLHGKMIS